MTIPLTSGSVVVTSPTAPPTVVVGDTAGTTVITSPGTPGPPGASLELAGSVATYEDLPTLGPGDAGSAYLVQENGKLYVWNGLAWPLEANGADFKGEKGDTGRGITDITRTGSTLEFHMSDASIDEVDVPPLDDALTAASDAAASATAAAGSATSASNAATAAAGSASAAASSQSAAATSASNASASAIAASTSASNAASSEGGAATSATAAGSSASAAAGSATTASTQATNAGNSATAAAGSATAAGNSATAAATSETNAAASASDAADSAAAAAQSAQDAADVVNSGIPNADNDTKGGILLPGVVSGELGGTYDHPTVVGWNTKADLVGGKIPVSQIPTIATQETYVVADQAGRLALSAAEVGDIAVQTGNPGRGTYILQVADPSVDGHWVLMNAPTDAVSSVNGYQGIVVLGKADVGLGNVDNTSDANKPVSTATQTALNGKANTAHAHSGADITSGTVPFARLPVGSTSTTVTVGNDARLSDTRTPTDNTVSTIKIQDGAVTSAKIADGTITDADIASAAAIALSKLATGRVVGSNNGTATSLTIWVGTEAQYTALGTKDANTLYFRTA